MPFADSTTPPPAWAVGSPAQVAAQPPEDPEAAPRTRGRDADPPDWARQIVLRQLTAAPRSRAELEQVLRRRNCPVAIAAAVLDRMEEVGGVDDETAQAALDEVDPIDEEDRARALVAKRMRSMSGLDPVVQIRRLAGMLARKGYPAELSMRIVREVVREAPEHQRD